MFKVFAAGTCLGFLVLEEETNVAELRLVPPKFDDIIDGVKHLFFFLVASLHDEEDFAVDCPDLYDAVVLSHCLNKLPSQPS